MRKIALVLVGMLIAGATWQLADAAPPSTAFCTRPGADVRTPSASGACPSGYTKTEVALPTEPPPPPPPPPVPFTVTYSNPFKLNSGGVSFPIPVSGFVPPGSDFASNDLFDQVIPVATTMTRLEVQWRGTQTGPAPLRVEAVLWRDPVGPAVAAATPLACTRDIWAATFEEACTATGTVAVAVGDTLFYRLRMLGPNATNNNLLEGEQSTTVGVA